MLANYPRVFQEALVHFNSLRNCGVPAEQIYVVFGLDSMSIAVRAAWESGPFAEPYAYEIHIPGRIRMRSQQQIQKRWLELVDAWNSGAIADAEIVPVATLVHATTDICARGRAMIALGYANGLGEFNA